MQVVSTIELPSGTGRGQLIRHLMMDLFGHGSSLNDSANIAVRTWDAEGNDILHISTSKNLPEDALEISNVAHEHGLRASGPAEDCGEYNPLWNAGLGGPSFGASADRLMQAATAATLRSCARIEAADQPVSPYEVACQLLIAHAAAGVTASTQTTLDISFPELLACRLLSYRSHYEGMYARVKRPRDFEDDFERRYREFGAPIRLAVSNAMSNPVQCRDTLCTEERSWFDDVLCLFSDIRTNFKNDSIVDAGMTLDDLNRGRSKPLSPTRFHGTPSAHMAWLLHKDSDFLAYRMFTSALYASIHTTGFSLPERYFLCYLVARANEDVTGRSVADLRNNLGMIAWKLIQSSTTIA